MTNYSGLEIKVNDQLLCRAGVESVKFNLLCVLKIVNSTQSGSEFPELVVQGSSRELPIRLLKWVQTELREGDKIDITPISRKFDDPSSVITISDSTELSKLEAGIKDFLKK